MEKVITLELLKKYTKKLVKDIPLLERNTSYSVGNIVKKKGIFLRCKTAGTTSTTELNLSSTTVGSTINDGSVAWVVINPYIQLSEWKASNEYTVGDVVTYDGAIYKCIKQNNDSTFSKNNFERVVNDISIQPISNEYIDTLFQGL